MDPPSETTPLLPGPNAHDNIFLDSISWNDAVFHIVCVIAGSGVLQLPFAMSQAGWSTVIFVILSAWVNIYTGKKIIKLLEHGGKSLDGYPAIGGEAFGSIGRIAVLISYNMAMMGSVCLYLILAAMNLEMLVGWLNAKQWIALISVLLLIPLLLIKSLKEVGWVSLLGASASVAVVIVVVIYGAIDYPYYADKVQHKIFEYKHLGSVLGTLCFSFGGKHRNF
jgi:amino acid permease